MHLDIETMLASIESVNIARWLRQGKHFPWLGS